MEYKDFTARTVDEAITLACLDLGVTSDRLEYDVVQEASGGFLGIGARPAIIKARARTEEELERERRAIEEAEQADRESVGVSWSPRDSRVRAEPEASFCRTATSTPLAKMSWMELTRFTCRVSIRAV